MDPRLDLRHRAYPEAPAKSLGDAEWCQWSVAVAGVMSVGGADVGDSGQAWGADGGVAEGGHDFGSGAGADLGPVVVVGDVVDPVDLVPARPVATDPAGRSRWSRLVDAEVGDGLDGLGGEAFRLVEAASAAAGLGGLGGVWEVDAGGDRQAA
ncbi:hypothetical protein [Micromonospora sp. S-DT3-3-22]|uniref:hypothetical protein n=1 Tax=Micromonospora sp. S-DT3-3-22 TaxID=2755359 RepID=UPI00188E8BBF|nr:hypothetical protein [Micromonospora sp. S-DT3-3-22]